MKYIKTFNFHSEYETYMNDEDKLLPNLSYCLDRNDTRLNDIFNGYKYVDLGLPSRTIWAKYNVGATKLDDLGLFFSWGDITGVTSDQIGINKIFSRDNYIFTDDNSIIKYNSTDNLNNLLLEDDAAHAYMGGYWRMPTRELFIELLEYTTLEWVSLNDTYGRLFTSTINNKELFIPAAGYGSYSNHYYKNIYADLFSSTKYDTERAYILGFGQNAYSVEYGSKFYGDSVRGVIQL